MDAAEVEVSAKGGDVLLGNVLTSVLVLPAGGQTKIGKDKLGLHKAIFDSICPLIRHALAVAQQNILKF